MNPVCFKSILIRQTLNRAKSKTINFFVLHKIIKFTFPPIQCFHMSHIQFGSNLERYAISRNTLLYCVLAQDFGCIIYIYEGRSESKERFAIQRYLLIIGKKQNMQVLSHTFTYFSTQLPWTIRHLSYRDTSLLIPSSYQKAAWLFCGIPNVR